MNPQGDSYSAASGTTAIYAGRAAPQTVPAWLAAMAPGTWDAIAGSVGQRIRDNLSPPPPDAGPTGAEYPESICNNWGGAVVITYQSLRRYMLPPTGGHNGGWTNDSYVIDLTDDAPEFRLYKPTGPTTGGESGFNSLANYSDGQGRGVHTYNHIAAVGPYVYHTGMDAHASAEGFTSAAHYRMRADKALGDLTATFDFVDNPLPVDGHVPPKTWIGGGAAYDSIGNRLYCCDQSGNDSSDRRFLRRNPDTQAVEYFNSPMVETGYNWIEIAEDLRLVIVGSARFSNTERRIFYAHIDNDIDDQAGTISWHQAAVTGTPDLAGMGQQASYHAPSRALFVWHSNGAQIRKCTIPATLTDAWVQSLVDPAPGNAVTPSAGQVNGTFGRFRIVRDIGGIDCFAVLNDIDEALYVFRIPAEGL